VFLLFRSLPVTPHHGAPHIHDGAQERAPDPQLQGRGRAGTGNTVVQGRAAGADGPLQPEVSPSHPAHGVPLLSEGDPEQERTGKEGASTITLFTDVIFVIS
jgi:hypothetical protein